MFCPFLQTAAEPASPATLLTRCVQACVFATRPRLPWQPIPLSLHFMTPIFAQPIGQATDWRKQLHGAGAFESLATAYRGKGLTILTETKLLAQLKVQAGSLLANVTPQAEQAKQSFKALVESLTETCWQPCQRPTDLQASAALEAALCNAGMFSPFASGVVRAWMKVLQSLDRENVGAPVTSDSSGILDSAVGEKMAHLFGAALLGELDSVHNSPLRLPIDPGCDAAIFTELMMAQLRLIKGYADGALEFTRTA